MATKPSLSGRQQAEQSVKRFEQWIKERKSANDWTDFLREGKLHRSRVAAECGFDRAAFRQNPALSKLLAETEAILAADGLFDSPNDSPAPTEGAAEVEENRLAATIQKGERRLKLLEEQNASLLAEVGTLRAKLARYQMIDDHLALTGRLLKP